MIEITARQIGGLIRMAEDYIRTLTDLKNTIGLTIEVEWNLKNAQRLMKEINDL